MGSCRMDSCNSIQRVPWHWKCAALCRSWCCNSGALTVLEHEQTEFSSVSPEAAGLHLSSPSLAVFHHCVLPPWFFFMISSGLLVGRYWSAVWSRHTVWYFFTQSCSFPDQLDLAWSHSCRRLAADTETVLNFQVEPPSSLQGPLPPWMWKTYLSRFNSTCKDPFYC